LTSRKKRANFIGQKLKVVHSQVVDESC